MLDYRTHTFLATYRLRSYTRAAEALHITQPAVSQHIRQLELHYGCALFARSGRGVEPTAAGHLVYRALSTMEGDEGRIGEEARAAMASDAGRMPLRFGCTRTIGDHVAPRLLAAHLRRHPTDGVLMRTGNTRELTALLETGEIDFALVEGSFDHALFEWERFSREPFAAIARSGEPPASLADLLPMRLVLREPGSGTRRILEEHLAARGLGVGDFAGTIELGSIAAIKACVRAGAGISFLYRMAAEEELASGELVDVMPRDLSIEHDMSLVWQRGSLYADRYRALLEEWSRGSGGNEDRSGPPEGGRG